jgi:hypothetical protein
MSGYSQELEQLQQLYNSVLVGAIEKTFLYKHTNWAIGIATTSAIISTLSSALIILIIFKSDEKLKNTYHRIMFVLSLTDMIYSSSVGLTTLPMPRDVGEVYPAFAGRGFGTSLTCTFQGFISSASVTFIAWINISLSVYYLLKIRYRTPKEKLRKYFEPIMLVLGLSICLIFSWSYLRRDEINPVPYAPWCSGGDYPFACSEVDINLCIRGGNEKTRGGTEGFKTFLVIYLMVQMVPHAVCFILNYISVRRLEKQAEALQENQPQSSETETETYASSRGHNYSKILIVQSAMYGVAFFACNSISAPLTFVPPMNKAPLQVLALALRPLQGFFCMLIFVYDKMYIIRAVNRASNIDFRAMIGDLGDDDEDGDISPFTEEKKLNVLGSIKLMVTNPSKVPHVVMSDLNLLRFHEQDVSWMDALSGADDDAANSREKRSTGSTGAGENSKDNSHISDPLPDDNFNDDDYQDLSNMGGSNFSMKSRNARSNAVSSTGLSFDVSEATGNANLNLGRGESLDDGTETNPHVTSNEKDTTNLDVVSDKKDMFAWKMSLFSRA